MIATSMALLSTGGDLVPTSEREAATLVQSGLLLSGGGERRSEERVSSSTEGEEIQIYDGELLLDSSLLLGGGGGQPSTGNSIGNFSPVYSPVSNASADSGLGGAGGLISPTAENDNFLAELFGSDFPLLSQSCSTAAIAPTTTSTSTESAPLAAVSSKPTATSTSANGIGPLFSSFSLKHMQTEQTQQQGVPSETASSKIKESEAERNRKNAEAARQNRLKKKRYLEELEKEHSDVKRENVILKTRCHEFQQRCQRLQSEVEYLKNVIANESMLSSLIQNIPNVPNVTLSSSFSSRKRPQAGSSSEDGTPASKRSKSSANAGICLHVAKDQVSIEFCQHCSKQATQS